MTYLIGSVWRGWDNERGIIMKRKGERFSDERREWRLPR